MSERARERERERERGGEREREREREQRYTDRLRAKTHRHSCLHISQRTFDFFLTEPEK